MRRVTLDTNVYISALKFGGEPQRILNMAGVGEIEIAISEPIIAETLRVLREKFDWPADKLERIDTSLRKLCDVVTPVIKLDVVPNDPDDNIIVECAIASESEAIVTGDKRHLLRLESYRGIKIISLRNFLQQQTIRR